MTGADRACPGADGAKTGRVYLVGAGPGDPGLLTVRGAEVLAEADVVVHDRLSSPVLLALAPPAALHIDVGKQPDDRGDQEAINQLLVEHAAAGRRVVRLKGGDPFVFGRGGEEALALQAAGISYEVVPGISSAVAAPAYAGVPVTQRGMVTSFTVAAGHTRSIEEGGTDWEALAATGGTIVVLMGASRRARIAERLMAGGLAGSTPVMAVQWGTEPYQQAVRTTLAELGQTPVKAPVTMVIGQVAGLDLEWYRSGPLAGRTVVVTRAAHQASPLVSALRGLGARPMPVPVIGVAPPADGGVALGAAAERAQAGFYAWAAFTSANAVDALLALVPDVRRLASTKLAAVGPATAAALERHRAGADLVASDHRAEGLVAAFPSAPVAARGSDISSVLLPQAAGARAVLRDGLAKAGWDVDAVEAYSTVAVEQPVEVLEFASQADAICFASPSAVNSYVDQALTAGVDVPPVVACIGPTTSAAARARGLSVAAEAAEHNLDGLLGALGAALGY
ncbi:MAG TPA: uroporphyrinogen-III C-methyltransferase [Acidimicrobiales bacterium]|nr:uroporphyrinogen-III C-methyltransferase [Acidimicrobiales bacterium]